LDLHFQELSIKEYIYVLGALLAFTGIAGYSMSFSANPYPYLDAAQFAFTIAGAVLVARSNISAQIFFGISNILAFTLMGLVGLYPALITNTLFFILAVFGYTS